MDLWDTLPGRREVHVWFVELKAGGHSLDACARSLSPDERDRASRFRFEHLKTSFTLSRGVLRVLLECYLGMEAKRLLFAYGPRGKPMLAFPETTLDFNLAHSGRIAAYAFAVGCRLGIDIEEIRPVADQEDIVRRFFSQEECEEWLCLDASERQDAFFRCWTRKEAFIKAMGDGLSMPLDSFQVSLRPEAPASLIRAEGDPEAAGRWSFSSLTPARGYTGSLALPEMSRILRILPGLTVDAVVELADGRGSFPPFD
jgi:4'-phosphopantetheinyl transferase